jgi:hypothetical protein
MDEAGRVQVQTRRAGPSDLDRAAEVLGEAFADYPWTRWNAKLRFEVAGHLRISGGGPDVWAMLRRPLAC